jgi:TatD DNase family protein
MIDFHCHLDLYPDPEAVVKDCVSRGLYVLSVTTTPTAWEGSSALVAGASRIRIALGLHPHLAHERKSELALFDTLISKTRYVGEVGLDGSPEFRTHWNEQVAVFEHVLSACRSAGGRIITIHSRRAAGAVLDRLEAIPGAGVPVLHWYSGGYGDLSRAIKLGCWFSVGPAMLRGAKGQALVARMPPDRVLTETDGPFAVIDGRSALPWDVESGIIKLAEVWSQDVGSVRKRLKDNLRRISQPMRNAAGEG